MGKINSRAKGASAERELAGLIYDYSGVRLLRNLEQTRNGGHDLVVSPDQNCAASDGFRQIALEVKRYNNVTPSLLSNWWNQAVRQAEEQHLKPVLCYRVDRRHWTAVLPLYMLNSAFSKSNDLSNTAEINLASLCMVINNV